ncbi:MAG: XamI DNA methyltransferase [Candidatus Roseilinea sp.]|nr:MAG: XamI DNA methyltransferase [Candidatus Roseilinea sp.]
MVAYVLTDGAESLFDPAVGTGAFLRVAKAIADEKGLNVHLAGMEIDPHTLAQAAASGLNQDDLAQVVIGDFVMQPSRAKFPAIVANPPYIRHHRLPETTKARLRRLGAEIIGKPLDGRAGLHVYFLIQALMLLEEGGRLAFIVPADTCEGRFALDLWSWITTHFALDAILTFAPEASPLPGVDTNPLVLFIRKSSPTDEFYWARCYRPGTGVVADWVRRSFGELDSADLLAIRRDRREGILTGLSRERVPTQTHKYVLGDFARVMRGVATGANDFFFMTLERMNRLGLPCERFVRAIGRTRDVADDEITQHTLASLEQRGRPTWLLSLNDDPIESFPDALRRYLQEGEAMGLPKRPLIAQRKPWYRMEVRTPPPFLFAYLGRRRCRFIRNTAGVVPLTGFLCVYPKSDDPIFWNQLWRMMNHPDTIASLASVGKSYGDGAIKVEPRLLERLPIPEHVIERFALPAQLRLLEHRTAYSSFAPELRE